ncbi:replication initiator protein A [Enterococcus pallens]|uniref:Replication initiator A N-terminal domain-containing protein n=1 Tax=Enterococcus pallens ATCC BAA-351 TaxID=1158607 RepID=R2S0F5_9ENTE|nr:replication initiator protein A [Enterococcus pallens]EOH86301.1 hypothetical protein UAU_05223 [Enterococcus pallens ATCC BAA-351]EOU09478.1 hypothetical protein I588_05211 [Enterococcus pallens ATCC BAA-351]OJG77527.1 hypothetical protein RV10_GL002361 [Enterococcus pallens]
MSDFKFFKKDRVYNELYYQFPKVLLVSDKYKKMSDSTKISYMLLKARLELAIYRNQIDEDGNVYFSFTQKELAATLGCETQKVKDILKALQKYDLLKVKNMGYNKKLRKRNPNRLYLAELEVTENDIYELKELDLNNDKMDQNVDIPHEVKITPSNENENSPENIDTPHGVKITPSQNVDIPHRVKITQELNNSKTLNTKETKRNEDDSIFRQKDFLLEGFADHMINQNKTYLPYKTLFFIESYSHSIEEAHSLMKKIHAAKANAEKLENESFSYEVIKEQYDIDIDTKITNTVRNVFMEQKTSNVKSLDGLMFSWSTRCFREVITQKRNADGRNKFPEVTLNNYLEEPPQQP